MKRALKVLLAVVGAIAVLLGLAYLYLGYAPVPAEPQLSGAVSELVVKVGDRTRHAIVYVPAQLAPGAPLVLVLHGSMGNGRQMRGWTGFELDALADARGFAVAYPDGYRGTWNDCRKHSEAAAKKENIDDVGFLHAVIALVQESAGIDPQRVYVFGFSNGGQMAYRLAMESPSTVAGIATVGSNLPVADNNMCPTSPTAKVMLVSGTADPLVPINGGEVTLFGFASRGFVVSADETARTLAARNALTTEPEVAALPKLESDDPTTVTRHLWERDGAPYVEQFIIEGGGHTVPQRAFRYPRALGRTSHNLDMPREAIDFFLR